MPEEIKIKVSADTDQARRDMERLNDTISSTQQAGKSSGAPGAAGPASGATQTRVQELYTAAAAYEAKGMDTAAKSARADARELERDLARNARERAAAEKDITREKQSQQKAGDRAASAAQAAAAREERSASRFMTRAAGVAGSAAFAAAGLVAENYFGRQTNSANAQAQQAINSRQIANMSGWRGDAGTLQAQGFGAQDQAFALQEERKGIEARKTGSMWQHGLAGAAGGAAIGTMMGGPWGALAGAIVGGIGGAYRAKVGSDVELDKNAKDQQTAKKQAEEAFKASQERFQKGEGAIEIEMLRNRSKRSVEGQRGAMIDQKLLEWAETYKQMRAKGGSDEMAKEAADLTTGNSIRDQQAQAGMSLVGARSGAAESAAAARWGMQSFPGMDQLAGRIDALHDTVKVGSQTGPMPNLAR
jgi:hypothetical protein